MTGLIIYNEAGTVQFSSNVANLHLSTKGAITTYTTFSSGQPGVRYWEVLYTPTGTSRPLIAVTTPNNFVAPLVNLKVGSQWRFGFLTESDVTQVNYWIFDRLPTPVDTYGLQVFAADGSNIWHSSQLPMRVTPPLITSDMPFNTWETSPVNIIGPVVENFPLVSGRSYAALFGAFSNYQTYMYMGAGAYAFAYNMVAVGPLSGGLTTSGIWYSRETSTTTTPDPALEHYNKRRMILPIDVTNY